MAKYPDLNPAMKLLEFAYKRAAAGQTFTAADVTEETGLTPAQFNQVAGGICAQKGSDYAMTQDALFRYLSYRAMKSADSHARNALIAAGVAVLISLALAVFQMTGPVAIEAPAPLRVTLTEQQIESLKPLGTVKLDQAQVFDLIEGVKAAVNDIRAGDSATSVPFKTETEE